jgi:hypothetical protein
MYSFRTAQNAFHTLRVASAMCFIGHGAFGIVTKFVWCNYFAVFGIGHVMAYRIMPSLGVLDISMGLLLLFYPARIIVLWLVLWGLITAALRPLSGEPLAEFLERAGNFGAPMALLLLCGTENKIPSWFEPIRLPEPYRSGQVRHTKYFLQGIAFLLLAGHGWLNLAGKKALLSQYSSLGWSDTHNVAIVAGLTELAMAFIVLIRPSRYLLIIFIVWKMASELFYPQWEIFEWIERGCSYGVLLALWYIIKPGQRSESSVAYSCLDRAGS